jgi:hypothetical protein
MRRLLLTAAGVTLLSAAALAASDIPERYAGAFPTVGPRTSITGTFTGKSLTLQFKRATAKRALRRTGSEPSPNREWICPLESLFRP